MPDGAGGSPPLNITANAFLRGADQVQRAGDENKTVRAGNSSRDLQSFSDRFRLVKACLIEASWCCGLQILERRGPRIIELSQNHLPRRREENRRDLAQRLVAHGAKDQRDWLAHELIEIVVKGSRRGRIVRAIEE